MQVKHALVSAIADDAVPAGKVQPSDWNADHDVELDNLTLMVGNNRVALNLGNLGATWSLSTGSANSFRAFPVLIPFRLKGKASVVQTNATSVTVTYAASLCEMTTTGTPGAVVADLGQFVRTASVTAGALDSSLTVDIAPGLYVLYLGVGATVSGASNILYAPVQSPVGRLGAAIQNASGSRFDATGTYSYPLPNPTSLTWTASATQGSHPILFKTE